VVARRRHGGEDGRAALINRRKEGKERGAASRSREVGEARHGEKGRLRVVAPWFVGCQMTERFGPGMKTTWGLGPGKKWGTRGDHGFPKGPLTEIRLSEGYLIF
jgi:hypothetical protein